MINQIFKVIFLAFCIGYAASLFSSSTHWSHDEQKHWGAIRDNTQTEDPLMFPYAVCSIGKHQSPVNLSEENHREILNKLVFNYPVDEPTYFNSGHGIQVNFSDDYKGHLKIGNEVYPLIQFHFHEPSEHVIGEKQYPAELHFVHIRDDGKIAVVGVLLDEGEENASFQKVLDNTPREEGGQNDQSSAVINPRLLMPKTNWKHYTLAGSLTTPPCSEGVEWLVLSEPITISREQLTQLRNFYVGNARHVQALNGRSVSRKIGQ